MSEFEFDLFISHASEDKDSLVRELANILKNSGLKVFYDEWELQVGDRLRESLDAGLKKSRYGLVVLSPHFFAKHWTRQELDALFALESDGIDRLLPIWHNVGFLEVSEESPMLADRLAVSTSQGIQGVAAQVIRAINTKSSSGVAPTLSTTPTISTLSSGAFRRPAARTPEMATWLADSLRRFQEIIGGPPTADERFRHGTVTFAYRLLDAPDSLLAVADVLDVMKRAEVHDSGWPPWWVPTRYEIQPYAHEGVVEVWLGVDKDTGAYSDFWRSSKDSCLYLVRGYQDDSTGRFEPASKFDPLLVLIRLYEVFRHLARMLEVRGAQHAEFAVEWSGLQGRRLEIWTDPMRGPLRQEPVAKQPRAQSWGVLRSDDLSSSEISSAVRSAAIPLFEAFGFFLPDVDFVAKEIKRFSKG